jgi:hypothetical protein
MTRSARYSLTARAIATLTLQGLIFSMNGGPMKQVAVAATKATSNLASSPHATRKVVKKAAAKKKKPS